MTGDGTDAVHGTRRGNKAGPLVEPVVRSTGFMVDAMADFDDLYEGRRAGYVYTRHANPTTDAVARRAAALERAEAAILTSSGMAAITSTLLTYAKSGGRVVAQSELYGAVNTFLTGVLPRFGVKVDRFPTTDTKALERLLADGPADAVYLESPTNPTLRLPDLRACAALARRHGVPSVVDSTFASPANSRPLDLGAEIVVHSATKSLAGHSDVTAGVVLGSRTRVAEVASTVKLLGGVLDAEGAYLVDRGMKTLPLRAARMNANALALATMLEAHPKVSRVNYPGLASHPQHALAKAQMPGGFGGMLSFDLDPPTREAGERFTDALGLAKNAATLGGVETLVMLPVLNSHRGQPAEVLASAGIVPGTVRVSCGIEDTADLVADFEQALARV